MEYFLIKEQGILIQLLSILISIYAANLSWDCNFNLPTLPRFIYAFFAFSFGATYLVLYAIFRYDQCK
jgi:hypothetical protein